MLGEDLDRLDSYTKDEWRLINMRICADIGRPWVEEMFDDAWESLMREKRERALH